MEYVILTALGVGGASVVGALLGFLIKNPSHKLSDIILSFAAGVMLCAATVGLIIPAANSATGSLTGTVVVILGVIAGAVVIRLIDKMVPHLHKLAGVDIEKHPDKTAELNKVLLFVIAIAIHNLPEGIAAGVGFGSDNITDAFMIAGGIALQNIPEGMVIIAPMLATGMTKKRAFFIAIITGLVEVVGTFLGYFAVSISSAILPFALAFAGGTMLYVISDEMIPETHAHGNEMVATFSLIVGFCVMLIIDILL
jgi:ZIP family zinc transporter